MPKYVGRRIVLKHGGIWDKTKEYEEPVSYTHLTLPTTSRV